MGRKSRIDAGAAPTMGSVVAAALAAGVDRLQAHEQDLRAGTDPEAVHQARVATRRLRSDLRTLKDFVDPAFADPLRDELRWLGGELGAVRDLDVLAARLQEHARALPDAERDSALRAIRGVVADRDAAHVELVAALSSARYAELRRTLSAAVTNPVLTARAAEPAAKTLPGLVRRQWKRLRKAVDALGEHPTDEALHAARIRAKRARYATEVASATFGKPAAKLASAFARVQEVLGDHQDGVVARAWLAQAAGESSATEAYALGMLAAIEQRSSAAAREAFPAVWAKAAKPKLRRWLG